MSDFYTPVIDTPTPKKNQETYVSPFSSKLTYRAPIIYEIFLVFCFLLLVILFISYQFIKITRQIKNNVLLICLILPGFFLIFLIVIGFKFNIYFSITIDGQNGKIYIKSIKIFCFIFKLKKILIKNISNISIENKSSKDIIINNERYYYLEINFNLINGKKFHVIH